MTTHAELTVGEQLQIREAAERLKRQFAGQLNVETIERFLFDSLDRLLGRAHTTAWVPLLAERFARDRIRAMIRLESSRELRDTLVARGLRRAEAFTWENCARQTFDAYARLGAAS